MRANIRLLNVCFPMGLMLLFLFGGSIDIKAGANIQLSDPKDILVTIKVKNKLIEDVMTDISAKTGLNFHYDKTDLNLKKKVTLSCNKTPIDEVLNLLAEQTGLKFTRKNNKIIVGTGGSTEGETSKVSLINSASLTREVKGTVRDNNGVPLPGVTVWIKHNNKGTQTNSDATYTINASPVDILVFRYVGFFTREITVGNQSQIDVTLSENVNALNEFVVTALGIQKKSRELTYATQQSDNDDLTGVKDVNVINSLAGKTAGVTITRSASGVGGSARVTLRGNKSTRENQPLYIINGVPLANFTPSQPTDIWGQSGLIIGTGGRDGGDGISNINPDDIESISILKGASAAALYGSQAANGVIVITTKKGKPGRGRIDFSSSLTLETPMLIPKLQYRYGQTVKPFIDGQGKPQPGSLHSWGDPVNVPDHVKGFFSTGTTLINAISLSGGTEAAQSYFSYSNTTNTGILPTNKFSRHTFNFRETLQLLNDKLNVDANILFLAQESNNRLSSGLYYSPLSGLYTFPRGQDFDSYKNEFEYADKSRELNLQNWWNIRNDKDWVGQDDQQNPYWALHRNLRKDKRYRGLASLTLKYQLFNWLSLQARGSFDKSLDQYELMAYAGTQATLSPSNGRYILEKEFNTQFYADVFANTNWKLSRQLHMATTLGCSITDVKAHDRAFNGANPYANPGLSYANKFSVSNILGTSMDAQHNIENKQLQALFASVQIGLKDYLFLDITGRNDWSSTFAFTPTMRSGYFYYSAGIAAVVSDMIKLPSFIQFAKLRTSFAKVGNDIAPYVSRPARFTLQTIAGVTRVAFNKGAPYPGVYLEPEKNQSFETGAELHFLNGRVLLDITYYKNNNYKQYMEVPAPPGSRYLTYYINLGYIQNQGWECMLTTMPVSTKHTTWTSGLNFSHNKNTIVNLSNNNIPGAGPDNSFVLTDYGVNLYGSFIKEGGSWGDIYTNKELVTNEKGQYIIDSNDKLTTKNIYKKVGNPNPDFALGWNNTISYKKISLNFLIDGRFGGQVMSVTQAILDGYGVSEESAAARDNGGVPINAVQENGQAFSGKMDAQKYYTTIGGRAGIGEMYMYDATNIRLRELSLGYNIPLRNKLVSHIKASIIGKNLCFLKRSAPFDPEVSMSTSNALQGVDVFGLPATRSIGASIKVSF
ncbi:SusC/RagA family TonB-linked outer membrane protein [Chitinophaga defluvii]|uniref:SusC/RagA family TonB-linked outer membrane protein n=1 Tax=Chitinophaga defluvii TaxID=3163343 RepID=A0ABV2TEY7_9BACT